MSINSTAICKRNANERLNWQQENETPPTRIYARENEK